LAGSLTITLLARLLGHALAGPLNVVLNLLNHHTIAATAVIVTAIGMRDTDPMGSKADGS